MTSLRPHLQTAAQTENDVAAPSLPTGATPVERPPQTPALAEMHHRVDQRRAALVAPGTQGGGRGVRLR